MGASGWQIRRFSSRSTWVNDVGVGCKQVGGHGWEVADREDDAHEAVPCLEVEMAGSEEVQLDLGLSDITEYCSYSKLWRTLYFINDAPFCIHKHGFNAAGEWVGLLSLTI